MALGVSPAAAGLLGGMGGGIAQAYATMGVLFCYRIVVLLNSRQVSALV